MSTDDRLARLDDDDSAGDYAELGALYASVVPVFGGVVSQVLSGWSAERRYQRVRDVLRGVAQDLARFKGTVREEYIRSDEFADLLDQTLCRVVTERSEAKRRLYRSDEGLLRAQMFPEANRRRDRFRPRRTPRRIADEPTSIENPEGTKSASLRVLQATKFELVIDLKTAKALGLTIS